MRVSPLNASAGQSRSCEVSYHGSLFMSTDSTISEVSIRCGSLDSRHAPAACVLVLSVVRHLPKKDQTTLFLEQATGPGPPPGHARGGKR